MTNSKTSSGGGILGIDAGGTFTDLAFLSGEPLSVTAEVKTPTVHDDLIGTIASGVDGILRQVPREQIAGVSLATTLATNAIVENKLRPMGLILIGYEPQSVAQPLRRGEFGTELVRVVSGGHNARGNELAPLDEAALEHALAELGPQVESLAVSSYFSVRNTDHELRALAMARSMLPGVYLTCGHELASGLNSIKRATTAALNAGLIPIVMDLLRSVEQVCRERGVDVPITVVRGDGSLVSADWAALHPVEMVLSGPASSARGACFLAGSGLRGRTSWAVDIGGTTTDVIKLGRDGKPAINPEGALVGRHRTLVRAIDINTFGLGGDSRVCLDKRNNPVLGPRRVRPLCVAAGEYPAIIDELTGALKIGAVCEPLFVFRGPGRTVTSSSFEKRILNRIAEGTHLKANLYEGESMAEMCDLELAEMESRGLVTFAGFTPTDALHVLGQLNKWDRRASVLGARLLAAALDISPERFAALVQEQAAYNMAFQVFRKSLVNQGCSMGEDSDALLDFALRCRQDPPEGSRLGLDLNASIIGVGAPAWAFVERAGELAGADALLPEHGAVAGAVGAAVGSFDLDYAVQITPLPTGQFRAHNPLGVEDFDDLETAVTATRDALLPWMRERARRAGAINPQVECVRQDDRAWYAGHKRSVYFGTHLLFTVSDLTEEKDAGN